MTSGPTASAGTGLAWSVEEPNLSGQWRRTVNTPGTGRAPRVVVVGAGLGGLAVVRELRRSPVAVTLIDINNYTTFQPMLFYVAVAFLASEDVVRPIRALLPRRGNAGFRMGRVQGVDWDRHCVVLADGRSAGFDYLVLAPGVVPAFGQVPGAAEHAVPLKSVTDATRLRNSILRSFEAAAARPELIDAGATSVVIVGGGASGIEVAGYLTDFLFQYSFMHDYPNLGRDRMRITVLEGGDRLLPAMDPAMSRYAFDRLSSHRVDVRLNAKVVAVDAGGVTLASGERVHAATVVWAGGVAAPGWVHDLGSPMKHGRVAIEPDLRMPGHPETFVIGDAAAAQRPGGGLYPQVAQLALQSGRHAASQIRRLAAGEPTLPFQYHDKGSMAIIGRNAAVIETRRLHLTGMSAWGAWGLLHLAYLPGMVNRLSAAQKWRWWHITHDSGTRVLFQPPTGSGNHSTAPGTMGTEPHGASPRLRGDL